MAKFALHLQRSPEHRRQPPANRQTKARATVRPARRLIHLPEVFEDLELIALRYADTRVDDRDGDHVFPEDLGLDGDTALRGELERIAEQVHEDLLHLLPIRPERGEIRRELADDL